MTTKKQKRFEARFPGRSNTGLRKLIRQAVIGCCGPDAERRVLSLQSSVALTASGLAALEAAAADYRALLGDFSYQCSCDDCYAGNAHAVALAVSTVR